jgi:hypothetical protein
VYTEDADITSDALAHTPTFSVFQERLLELPSRWQEVCEVIAGAALDTLMRESFADSLQPVEPVSCPRYAPPASTTINARRASIADFSNGLAFAERAQAEEFLATESLQALVMSHRTELPIAVSVGAKGAGKTFTELQMIYQKTWARYGAACEVDDLAIDAPIIPALTSKNLDQSIAERVERIRMSAAISPTLTQPIDVRDELHRAIDENVSERQWREVWLWVLARSIGLDVAPGAAESALLVNAQKGFRGIFVIDGLEDVFQDVNTNDTQQRALRALLQDTLDWLRNIRGRPIGLVVFVRRDLVRAAIKQNSQQFIARYSNYELKWNETEAVRLASWVCAMSNTIEQRVSDVRDLDAQMLTEVMIPVWGDKLGTAGSREARSKGWFIAALSDFTGSIQARDIVLFLNLAAQGSIGDTRWTDRL